MNIQNTQQKPSFGFLARVDVKLSPRDARKLMEDTAKEIKSMPLKYKSVLFYPFADMGGIASASTQAYTRRNSVHMPIIYSKGNAITNFFVICGEHMRDFMLTCAQVSEEYRILNSLYQKPPIKLIRKSIAENMQKLIAKKGKVLRVTPDLPITEQLKFGIKKGDLWISPKIQLVTESNISQMPQINFPKVPEDKKGLKLVTLK
jgi:hypothetical protein